MVTATVESNVHLRNPEKAPGNTHVFQKRIVESPSKRIIVKAGRRGAKTVSLAIRGVKRFVEGKRVLYAAPTAEQTDKYWFEVKRALAEQINLGEVKCNESEQFIEKPGTENRIKAKTAWSADMLRGDWGDELELDEVQLMAEAVWEDVCSPMLIDHNGTAVLCFTPPSLKSSGISKAKDPRWASKLFKDKLKDTSGLWECIHFTSHDNPFVSEAGLQLVAQDMSLDSYRREIMAEDDEIETSWLVHSKFNESLCKFKRFTIPLNWSVFSAHDFGSANPAGIFAAQVKLPLPPGAPAHLRYGDLVIFREYAPGPGFSYVQNCDRFKEFTKGYSVELRLGGNFTSEQDSRDLYATQGWPIIEPQIKGNAAQYDRVIALEEQNKINIFDDCYVILSEMANCLWKLDSNNKPTNDVKDEKLWHLLSCLRYLATHFTPETVSRGEGKAWSY